MNTNCKICNNKSSVFATSYCLRCYSKIHSGRPLCPSRLIVGEICHVSRYNYATTIATCGPRSPNSPHATIYLLWFHVGSKVDFSALKCNHPIDLLLTIEVDSANNLLSYQFIQEHAILDENLCAVNDEDIVYYANIDGSDFPVAKIFRMFMFPLTMYS